MQILCTQIFHSELCNLHLWNVVRADRLRVGEGRLEDVDGGVGKAELGDRVKVEALAAHVEPDRCLIKVNIQSDNE